MRIKKKLALLLTAALLVTSVNVTSLTAFAVDNPSGTANTPATGSTRLTLDLTANKGYVGRTVIGSTKLTLVISAVTHAQNKEDSNYGGGTIEAGISDKLTADIAYAISGGKKVLVWLETKDVSDNAPAEDEAKIEQNLPETYQIGAIVDIQLLQQKTGEDVPANINKTSTPIRIRIGIPSDILKDGRSYKVIRVHDGKVDILNATRDGNDLTFASDSFSTYAIIYSDEDVESKPKNVGGEHVHVYEWGNWGQVSKDEDGTKVYQCIICGHVLEKELIPAYAYTCLTESERVLKTPQNGSVICDMGRWNSYPRWFFEKLATRPDVNITLKFLYQNKQYTVYIPAGTKIDTECDWYGPLKICSLYQFEVK